MMQEAPRAFNRNIFYNPTEIYYGTDDGAQDGSFHEFTKFKEHYNSVGSSRKEDIHMISVVGGLYGLNFIPLWQPTQITIFDINPVAVSYFKIILRVLTTSDSAKHFLNRLREGDYEVSTEEEQFLKENISLHSKGQLPRSRGSSKRSYEESWQHVLENFDLTKRILTEVTVDIRTEPMESGTFSEMIKAKDNVWIYASNITQFHYFDLEILDPSNVVVTQIIFPEKAELLDLAPYGGNPVKLKFQIPLAVEKLNA